MLAKMLYAMSLVGGLLTGAASIQAYPLVVDFTSLGTLTTSELSVGGVTVTADDGVSPALVNVLSGNGLGVVGGLFDNAVDTSEALLFEFDACASEVVYHVVSAGNQNGNATVGDSFLVAFDSEGASLGVISVTGTGEHVVSASFGHQAISAFRVRADIDNLRIDYVTYIPRLCVPCISVVSGDWDQATTWDCGSVPGAGDEAQIASGHIVTLKGDESVQTVTIASGGTLEDEASNTLEVRGNFLQQGVFIPRQGQVKFTGPRPQVVAGNPQLSRLLVQKDQDSQTVAIGAAQVEGQTQVERGTLEFGDGARFGDIAIQQTAVMRPQQEGVQFAVSGDFQQEAGARFEHRQSVMRAVGSAQQTFGGAPTLYRLLVQKDQDSQTVAIGAAQVEGQTQVERGTLEFGDGARFGDIAIQQTAVMRPQQQSIQFYVTGDFQKEPTATYEAQQSIATFNGLSGQQNVTLGGTTTMDIGLVNQDGLFLTQTLFDGTGQSTIGVCATTVVLDEIDTGDQVFVYCGSLTAEVTEGPVQIHPGRREELTAIVPAGATITSTEVGEGLFRIENSPDSQGTVVVEVDGARFELQPGEHGVYRPGFGGAIPTVSEWGLVIATLLLLTSAKIYFGCRYRRSGTEL